MPEHSHLNAIEAKRARQAMTPSAIRAMAEAQILAASLEEIQQLDPQSQRIVAGYEDPLARVVAMQYRARADAALCGQSVWLKGEAAREVNQVCIDYLRRDLVFDHAFAAKTETDESALQRRLSQIVQIMANKADAICSQVKSHGLGNARNPG